MLLILYFGCTAMTCARLRWDLRWSHHLQKAWCWWALQQKPFVMGHDVWSITGTSCATVQLTSSPAIPAAALQRDYCWRWGIPPCFSVSTTTVRGEGVNVGKFRNTQYGIGWLFRRGGGMLAAGKPTVWVDGDSFGRGGRLLLRLPSIRRSIPMMFPVHFTRVTVVVILGCFIFVHLCRGHTCWVRRHPKPGANKATRDAGIHDMRWTKADFKVVVKTHFASIGVFAVFVTVVVSAIYAAAIYSCCNVRQGWRKKRYLSLCNCTSCRCTRCVKLCMKCGPECGACCAACCDLRGDEDDRMLTGV